MSPQLISIYIHKVKWLISMENPHLFLLMLLYVYALGNCFHLAWLTVLHVGCNVFFLFKNSYTISKIIYSVHNNRLHSFLGTEIRMELLLANSQPFCQLNKI